ncbi:hypothetical protein MRB53_040701 [Persea americana]|nr:hypothetical protein MRB53_040701 [Persea americana]
MLIAHTNCSLPQSGTRFVTSPDVRGTLDILWLCLSTLLLCTYSIQHLTLPPQCRPQTMMQKYRVLRNTYLRNVTWMLLTLFFPELIWSMAWTERRAAYRNAKQMRSSADADGVEWSPSHSYLANMGGFIVYFGEALQLSNPADGESVLVDKQPALAQCSSSEQVARDNQATKAALVLDSNRKKLIEDSEKATAKTNQRHWTPQPSFRESYIGLHLMKMRTTAYATWAKQAVVLQGDTWVINAEQLRYIRDIAMIPSLPNLTRQDIADVDKGDTLVKALTVLQITWLVIQLIGRTADGLASSQLEIATVAFSACAIVTYLLIYEKPKDVRQVRRIECTRLPTIEELKIFYELRSAPFADDHPSWDYLQSWSEMPEYERHHSGGISSIETHSVKTALHSITGFTIGGTLFGGASLHRLEFHLPHRSRAYALASRGLRHDWHSCLFCASYWIPHLTSAVALLSASKRVHRDLVCEYTILVLRSTLKKGIQADHLRHWRHNSTACGSMPLNVTWQRFCWSFHDVLGGSTHHKVALEALDLVSRLHRRKPRTLPAQIILPHMLSKEANLRADQVIYSTTSDSEHILRCSLAIV